VKITLLVEGATERAFLPKLREYLSAKLLGKMPTLDVAPFDGPIPRQSQLRRQVELHLRGKRPADAVIALTDVYTGTGEFVDAADAKAKMRRWVGKNAKFYPHAAQYEFEAWLLPYWETILRLAGHNKKAPVQHPEQVNHVRPPSRRIREVFQAGKCERQYNKRRDAARILRDSELQTAIDACGELRAFVSTILLLCGGDPLP
jgi:hypothetical protein